MLKLSILLTFFSTSVFACDEQKFGLLFDTGEYLEAYEEIMLCERLEDLSAETISKYGTIYMYEGYAGQDSPDQFANKLLRFTTLMAFKGDEQALEMLIDLYSEDFPEGGFMKNLTARDCLVEISRPINKVAVEYCLALDASPPE